MNVVKVSVECKRSKNFQTESVSMEASLEEKENPLVMVKLLQKNCRELAEEMLSKKLEDLKDQVPFIPTKFGGVRR